MGDGQIPYVVDHEVKAIQDTLIKVGMEEKDIKFAFIVVNKRINTKFIQKLGSNHTNPPSGTIVDDVVTLPERYDFFLISQSVTQGTVNPTSYNVIKVSKHCHSFLPVEPLLTCCVQDTSGLSPEHLQKLTYKLAYLYYNWPGTVRVPAPCQYAHKVRSSSLFAFSSSVTSSFSSLTWWERLFTNLPMELCRTPFTISR